jgi:hypothetical protein
MAATDARCQQQGSEGAYRPPANQPPVARNLDGGDGR